MATIDRRGATVSATDAPASSTPNPDLAIKTAVRVVATSNINIQTFGLGTIDSITLSAGDRVLLTAQTDATQNGIYNAGTGVWGLASDFQNNTQIACGLQVHVNFGTVYGNTLWWISTPDPIVLGTSAITFSQSIGFTGTVKIAPPANSLVKGLDIEQTVAGTAPATAAAAWNIVNVSDNVDASAAGADEAIALYVQYFTGGSNVKGSRAAIGVNFTVGADSSVSSANRDYVGVSSLISSTAAMPVTATPATLFAFAGGVTAGPGSTGLNALVGAEIDIAPNVAGIPFAYGWAVSYQGSQQASTRSAGYVVEATATGWQYGFIITKQAGHDALASTGTVLYATDAQTVAKGVDFSNLTFTGNAWTSPGASITSAGAVNATQTVTVTGTTNDGFAVTDSTVTGVLATSALLTHSLAVGTTSNHPIAFVSNNALVGSWLPAGALTVGPLSIGATSTDGLVLSNTTAAAAGAQQWSPRLHWTSQGWKTNATAASQTVDFIAELQPVQGSANPSGNLVISAQVNGGGYTALYTFGSDGGLTLGSPTGGDKGAGTINVAGGVFVNNVSTSGTTNPGTAGQLAYYATSTAAVSGNANATISNGALTLGASTVIGQLILNGSSSGTTTLQPVAAASGTLTLPPATDTVAVLAASQAFTNKTYNGLTITSSTGTLTITNGKTLTANSTLTLAGTDGKTLTVSNNGTLAGGDGFTLAVAANKTLTASNSLTLAGTDGKTLTLTNSLTVTTNDGTLAFGAASKTLTVSNSGTLAGGDGFTLSIAANKTLTASNSLTLAGTDGKSLTLTNGLTVSGNDGTLSFGAASKTLTVNNSLTLAGTDATTMTFPGTSQTIAGLAVSGQTFTTAQTITPTQAANTSVDGLVLADTTAASAGNQQYSPRLRLTGQGWKTNATAASQTVDWIIETQPVQGAANPNPLLNFSSQTNGAGYNARLQVVDNIPDGNGLSVNFLGVGSTQFNLKLSGAAGAVVYVDSGQVIMGAVANVTVNLVSNNTTRIGISNAGAVTFPSVGTTASAANAFLDNAASNNLLRSTSSLRYKTNVRPIALEELRKALNLSPVRFNSTSPADDPDREFVGLAAERVAEELPDFIHLDPEGRPDGVQYDRIAAVALLAVVKDQQKRIEVLEAALTTRG